MSCNDYTPVVKPVNGGDGEDFVVSRTNFATNGASFADCITTFSNARQLAAYSRELAGHALEYARLTDEVLDGFETGQSLSEIEPVLEQAIGLAGAMRLTWDDLVKAAMTLESEGGHA